jgi:hypothetical protein
MFVRPLRGDTFLHSRFDFCANLHNGSYSLSNMQRDFFDPTPEQQIVVLIDAATLHKAQRMITGCEACTEDAELPFENILDRLTGSDPTVTDYILEVTARCLQCGASIT